MRESFGSDGQPGSYTDIDFTDCIMMVGHNMASTQTVLWYEEPPLTAAEHMDAKCGTGLGFSIDCMVQILRS
jgi:anaerobic selenocysteine-containing dehydrogenase